MSDELDQFRDLRPQVPPPARQAREAALEQLRAAVLREAKSGGVASESGSPRRSRRQIAPNLGLVVTLAASVAVVVVVAAIALLAHTRHRPSAGAGHDAAVRGEILDQYGHVLVDNRVSYAVQINPAKLPATGSARTAVYERLAAILGTPATATSCRIAGHGVQRLATIPCDIARHQALTPSGSVTFAADISLGAVHQIVQQAHRLPGVSTRISHPRAYPEGNLAGQLLGTVGQINPAELRGHVYSGASAQSEVGQSGLEAQYDRYLRAGNTLQTSLNARLQQAGQQALQHAISTNPPSTGGAFVALNPETGAVYAMGSLPTFNPSIFTTGNPSQRTYHRLTSKAGNEPLLNRAIDSAGPTGSTFKPITATAALESGNWTAGSIYNDTGSFQEGAVTLHNAGSAAYGPLDMVNALRVSSDTFFYNLGARTNVDNPFATPQGGPLQTWARRFGIGRASGIDLPGESSGTLPSPAFRESRNRLESACDSATGPFRGKPRHTSGGCGIADGTNRPWSIGDNINLAVGQGDVQATPLQLAVAYAAIANGGTIVRPHIANAITSPGGTVLQPISPAPVRHLKMDPLSLQTVRAGLRGAASQPGGTSSDVFGNFPKPVYGEAGTAQSNGQADSAWYAGYVPASATNTPITVVVWIQQGGFGDVSAAPVARQILSQWLLGKKGPWIPGRSTTR